jgi:hypothetical protein
MDDARRAQIKLQVVPTDNISGKATSKERLNNQRQIEANRVW